jgi:hypothetical protein
MGVKLQGLLEEIENARGEMVRIASDSSLGNHRVIEASMRLDFLINKYFSLMGRS